MTAYSRSPRRVPPEEYRSRRYRTDETQNLPGGDPWMPQPEPDSAARLMLVPLAVGSAVAITLGVYGRTHTPTGIAVNLAGFSGPVEAKVWLGMGAFVFALVQVLTAFMLYGKLGNPPEWIGAAHRWSGRIAFLLAVPVAVHCLYAAGFSDFNARTFVHSLLGCLFFGAFAVKMLGLRKDGLPNWVLPTLGGVVFALLVGVWWTSSLWFFYYYGFQY